MALNSIGDLARGLTLQLRSTQIKREIESLSRELSTGKVANIREHLHGDFSQISLIDHDLTRLATFSTAASEVELSAGTMRTSLTVFQNSVSELSSALLAFGSDSPVIPDEQISAQALNHLDTMMSALNTRVGGRNLFSGTATDRFPLAAPETLLASLQSELSGMTTAAEILQTATNWFEDPAGFRAAIYQGSAEYLAPMQVSDQEKINLLVKADDPVFRAALRDTAVAVLASDSSLDLTADQRAALFKELGAQLTQASDETVRLTARIGMAEARAEQAAARNAASRTGLEYARSELIGADPYETATRLQAVQFQLESLYSVTVRNANLSLVNFLR